MASTPASTSRRSFLSLTTAASAAVALRIVTEPMLARAREHHPPAGSIMIDANENPLGPCVSAREAVVTITPQGGRYLDGLTEDLAKTIAETEGLKPDYVHIYPGSSDALHHSVCAFTSPAHSYVTADPGYEAGMFAAAAVGARVVKVPLTRTYAHDVKAMLAAGSDAGVFYVCSPNNPTGTLTSHSDIEYLVENKPKGSIVLIDEAYIHFSDATTALDLVKADKDVIVLRTFSKLYGMAGLRCGAAIARPELLEKIHNFGGWNFMPVTAMVAATASLKHTGLVQERKKINAGIREETFQWLDRNGYSYVRSESNCFMLDTKRPAKEVIDAMATQKVFIGRIWPVWPTYARITVGTRPEMDQFQDALKKVMSGAVTAKVAQSRPQRRDGMMFPV
ncbi:MAG: pyridoxal phosphate-dependent aminotransferase [Acidobacteria bacterium]|nr:pyridoxal phosphate-dependent aminotransferase [Acidobacteriota bacterium]